MKKIFLLCIGLCLSFNAFSQEKYAAYNMSYFRDAQNYDIEIGKPDKKGVCRIYIDIQCMENIDRPVQLMIDSNKINEFKASLESAKEKYIEWRQVAVDNNVDDVRKDIDVRFPYVSAAFVYGDWHFDFSVYLSSRFVVLADGKYLLIVDVDNIVASDNQYMDTEGAIVFSNLDEINTFINKLDIEGMQAFANNKTSTENLFE